MTDLFGRLQVALGSGYRLEKELGGGGMSRVFLAEEVQLGRRVVVKVLPPEMAAGVNVDRFRREIQLAARLQHPHIVPLLSAGASGDLLFYVMPFIEGESLRAKLAREAELPVPEALRILRDVLDALAYAHSHRVVHRDIKPDNVLLSGRHALVTDFGVAKAVAESTGKQTLTSLGVALGTPAYMAPEQATADPHMDHRADLYAVGALVYEMLCGRPPFVATTAQAMLAAHVADVPDPVTKHRSTVPESLNHVVLRCLEKKPADRWQRADELLQQVESLLTPTGGITPTGTQPVISSGTQAAIDRAHPARVAALFGLASVGVLAIVYVLVQVIGLPDWVFYGAIGLLATGLPIMLLTGHHERQRAVRRSSGRFTSPDAGGLERHFTWRKALLGGGLAFAGLGVIAIGYMAMRLLGIGPVGTLVASGVLGQQERILVAEFGNGTPDSGLGETVTDLFRIALAQSRVITVMEPAQVAVVLERMRQDRSTPVTPELAAEVAAREGIKAFVTGEIRPVGEEYVVSARLVAAGTGAALTAVSEPAAGSAGLIQAVGRVSARLRERIGESLRTLRSEPPLEQVTTTSLDALRLYSQANRLRDQGDLDQAIALLQQAVGRDSTFAMAYRRLAAFFLNTPATTGARGREALIRAYALRDRLSDRERYHVEGLYADGVEQDFEKAVTAYVALLERYPNDATAMNNLGRVYGFLGRFRETEELYQRAIEARVAPAVTYTNLMWRLLQLQRVGAADTILTLLAERFAGNPEILQWTSNVAAARRDWTAASQAATHLLDAQPAMRSFAHQRLAGLAQVRGRLGEVTRHRDEAARIDAQRLRWEGEERDLLMALHRAELAAWLGWEPARTGAELERLWQMNQRIVAGRPPLGRRQQQFVPALAAAGRPALARRMLEDFRTAFSEGEREQFAPLLSMLEADVLLGEGRFLEAVASYRSAARGIGCPDSCLLARIGRSLDQAGMTDSALAAYRHYADTPPATFGPPGNPTLEDERWLAPTYRRLGELYEQRGERASALDYYGWFVELWKDADPELQPLVREVRARMAGLAREPSR